MKRFIVLAGVVALGESRSRLLLLLVSITVTPPCCDALSLPVTAGAALLLRRERRRIVENISVFVRFLRDRDMRGYLESRRSELEGELARLLRAAKRGATLGAAGVPGETHAGTEVVRGDD